VKLSALDRDDLAASAGAGGQVTACVVGGISRALGLGKLVDQHPLVTAELAGPVVS
jgi:hypothetical protein